jgi:hypothetical protein
MLHWPFPSKTTTLPGAGKSTSGRAPGLPVYSTLVFAHDRAPRGIWQ